MPSIVPGTSDKTVNKTDMWSACRKHSQNEYGIQLQWIWNIRIENDSSEETSKD